MPLAGAAADYFQPARQLRPTGVCSSGLIHI